MATHRDRKEREERMSLTARALTDVERAARKAKTARLREQRLGAEAGVSKPDGDDLKLASAKKKRRVIHVR
jgi:hypothetical protein